jgi:2-oxoglutarate dehydrogenase E2 component (dihydrolipoamide succinyltransferase)
MAKVEILFPQMGESIVEGTITTWLKKPGDKVEKDETILEISTDKVDSEVPASHGGVLEKILAEEGDRVEVGQAIGIMETDAASASAGEKTEGSEKESDESDKQTNQETSNGDSAAADKRSESKEEPAKESDSHKSSESSSKISGLNKEGRFYSPLVRTMARDEGVNESELDQIEGTGENGRVTKKDFLEYLKQRKSGGARSSAGAAVSRGAGAQGSALEGDLSQASRELADSGLAEIEVMDNMRKVIAERMWESVHRSPHVCSFHEVDVTSLVNYRNAQKKHFQAKYGFNLTYTMLIAEATVRTLQEFPYVNASLEGDTIVKRNEVHLGVAVSVDPMGLMVPVLKNADEKNLLGLARSMNDLVQRTRKKQVQPDELSGGTFSITNLGTFGSLTGTPIINQPNVAILGLGAIKKKPMVLESEQGDSIAIRSTLILSLSYDHRLVDGALGGKFLASLDQKLSKYEGPDFR